MVVGGCRKLCSGAAFLQHFAQIRQPYTVHTSHPLFCASLAHELQPLAHKHLSALYTTIIDVEVPSAATGCRALSAIEGCKALGFRGLRGPRLGCGGERTS